MSDVTKWSPIAASNDDPPPDGAPEGMSASALNDTIRENMAATRRLTDDGGWFDWGHAYTYVAGDQFQAAGVTGGPEPYHVGRRVRVFQPTRAAATNTVTGSITASSGTTNVSVTIQADSGALVNDTMEVQLGPEEPATPRQTIPDPIPTGALLPFGAATAPSGYLLCNGAAVSRTTYADLFAVIGTTFGAGDGSTTFNVPDMTDTFPLGDGTRLLGDIGGAETHQLTVAELPQFTQRNPASTAQILPQVGGLVANDNNVTVGSDQPHNNMPPYLALRFIIKT